LEKKAWPRECRSERGMGERREVSDWRRVWQEGAEVERVRVRRERALMDWLGVVLVGG